MNDHEKNQFAKYVARILAYHEKYKQYGSPESAAILAADAELARLRAIMAEYSDMEDWLRKNHGYFDYMDEDDTFQFTRERSNERHFAHGKTLLEAYRKVEK